MKLYKLLKYDIKIGILKRWYLYFLVFVGAVLGGLGYYYNLVQRGLANTKGLTVINIFMYMFAGKEQFNPEVNSAFVFPIEWLLLFVFEVFIVLDYAKSNLLGHGVQVILRMHERNLWWCSKCVWVLVSTVLYFAIIYCAILLDCLLLRIPISINFSNTVNEKLIDLSFISISQIDIILFIIVAPFFTALAANFLQLILTLFMKETHAFLVIVTWLFASTYYKNILLIGNYAMIKRNKLCIEGGIDSQWAIIIDLFIVVLCIILGMFTLRKYDIIKK
ncbi:MAG: hypothetical protein II013_06015 [Lachnobacterium sp.]|nr:hypothetical protein [Lachnobacterium sp.]